MTGTETTPLHCEIRELKPGEYAVLPEFLLESIYVPEGTPRPPASLLEKPELQVYTRGFGTERDDWALAAEADGCVVGVIWARIMQDYGHVDDATPSLAMAVLPGWRRRGIGRALLEAMLNLLAQQGYSQTSLSVQRANSAALRLYEKVGFVPAVSKPEELIMVCDLTARRSEPIR